MEFNVYGLIATNFSPQVPILHAEYPIESDKLIKYKTINPM